MPTSREELEKTVETLKSTQNQLIQSEKLSGIGEFVSGVAHELNNPLTSVMGFAELLQQSELPEIDLGKLSRRAFDPPDCAGRFAETAMLAGKAVQRGIWHNQSFAPEQLVNFRQN